MTVARLPWSPATQEPHPPLSRVEIEARVPRIQDAERRAAMVRLLHDFDDDDEFWDVSRHVQIYKLLAGMDAHGVCQRDIAVVVGVVPSRVSKLKYDFLESNSVERRRADRPSPLDDVFPETENFIAAEKSAGHAVTLTGLLAFLEDDFGVVVTRKSLWEYMTLNGYSYVSCVPQESVRVELDPDEIADFYTRTLHDGVDGVNPMLVFNVDEMGTSSLRTGGCPRPHPQQHGPRRRRPPRWDPPRAESAPSLAASPSTVPASPLRSL